MSLLNPKLFTKDVEKTPTRHGFGDGLVAAAKRDKRVVALCADLTESTRMHLFREKFPKRFIQVGVAEQNMTSVAAGLALSGLVPFAASYATFSPGRSWDQVRVSVCYNQANVKFTGNHAGLLTAQDGATHQALEDIAITRVLPGLTVLVPCDYHEAYKATLAAAKLEGPVYLRLGRPPAPVVTTAKSPFRIGQAITLLPGKDVTVIACGIMVYYALLAARAMGKSGVSVEVINMHTIKPLDRAAIIRSVRKTRAVVSAEEHQITGGLGGAVAEVLTKYAPVPQEFVGVRDRFGESGAPDDLLKKYGLTEKEIIAAIKIVLRRKSK